MKLCEKLCVFFLSTDHHYTTHNTKVKCFLYVPQSFIASTSSVRARQVTIACKSAGVLGGQDRQVVLSAVGVQSGKPTTVTINLVRD